MRLPCLCMTAHAVATKAETAALLLSSEIHATTKTTLVSSNR